MGLDERNDKGNTKYSSFTVGLNQRGQMKLQHMFIQISLVWKNKILRGFIIISLIIS